MTRQLERGVRKANGVRRSVVVVLTGTRLSQAGGNARISTSDCRARSRFSMCLRADGDIGFVVVRQMRHLADGGFVMLAEDFGHAAGAPLVHAQFAQGVDAEIRARCRASRDRPG